MTAKPVYPSQLKTYVDVLAQYHLHPESKFLNGDFCDAGQTQRRHIIVNNIRHIGKEANKWEEQFFTGFDPDAQLEYGQCPQMREQQLQTVLTGINTHGATRMAKLAGLSAFYVRNIRHGKANPSNVALGKLVHAVFRLSHKETGYGG